MFNFFTETYKSKRGNTNAPICTVNWCILECAEVFLVFPLFDLCCGFSIEKESKIEHRFFCCCRKFSAAIWHWRKKPMNWWTNCPYFCQFWVPLWLEPVMCKKHYYYHFWKSWETSLMVFSYLQRRGPVLGGSRYNKSRACVCYGTLCTQPLRNFCYSTDKILTVYFVVQ